MKRFEYKVIPIGTLIAITAKQNENAARELEKMLNDLGKDGWELIEQKDGFFFLKREL